MNELIEKWNRGHSEIPKDKSFSNYAEEKELLFPRNGRVLDIGGGTGADAIFFCGKGHRVTVVDISDYALEKAREKAEEHHFPLTTMRVTLGEEPFMIPPKSYEVIYSRLALHYFNRITTVTIFKQMSEALAENGRAFITVKSPIDENEMNFLKKTAREGELGVFNDDGEIKSRYTEAQWAEILKEAGLTNYTISLYKENMKGKIDKVKSGSHTMLLTEIQFTK